MMFKTVFRLPYRQARGFTEGFLKLMNLDHLDVPSFSQVNRRFRSMDVAPFDIPKSGSITIAIDSTGVKVYGEGDFSNFSTHGMQMSDVPQSVINDMTADAAAPQYLDGIINSGSTIPSKIPVTEGFTLYKVVPQGGSGPSPFTPYWGRLNEFNNYGASPDFEKAFGLPVSSQAVRYDVYKIQVKNGESVNIYESTIANTSEAGYLTTGGATQSLVLDRSKWTDPVLVSETEIFPPSY